MSSSVGYTQIQGIIKGKIHFGSALEGNIYSPENLGESNIENVPDKKVEETESHKRLRLQREQILAKNGKDRIIPEKPKKKHKLTVTEIAEPFYPPVQMDELLEPEIDRKYWNKDIWGTNGR